MAVRGAAASSLLLKKGFDRRKGEELLKVFKEADTNQVNVLLPKLNKFQEQPLVFGSIFGACCFLVLVAACIVKICWTFYYIPTHLKTSFYYLYWARFGFNNFPINGLS